MSIVLELPVDNFIGESTCTKCGGECCKKMPGLCEPEDFALSRQKMIDALRTRNYAIDYWDGDIRTDGDLYHIYYIRPATLTGKWPVDTSWGGQCRLLTPTGCSLAPDDRPIECRGLKPRTRIGGDCRTVYGGKKDCVRKWIPYQT